MSQNQQHIWLTGASTGIGMQLAKQLITEGHYLYLTSRSLDKLNLAFAKEAKQNLCSLVPADLAEETQVKAACQKIQEKTQVLDCIILNAGTSKYVDVQSFDHKIFHHVMQANFFSMVYCIEYALPLLRALRIQYPNKRPYIVGMSSSVAYLGLSRAEAYGTSKAAIDHFLQSLRVDLTKENFDISVIYPGFVRTPLTDKNDFPMPMLIEPTEASQHIVKGMKSRKHAIRFPTLFVFILRLIACLPSRIKNKILQNMIRD